METQTIERAPVRIGAGGALLPVWLLATGRISGRDQPSGACPGGR